MKTLRLLLLLIWLALRPVTAAGQDCPVTRPLALVLSGGGAKGLAHIGVLQVLDSLGIRPDLVVGTSMGSIVGAMYASGMSPRQIEEQARGLGLSQIIARNDPRTPRSLGERRPLVVWQPGAGGFRTGDAGARQASVSAALNRMLLRGNLTARGNFDSLPIPFRAIATDLRTRAEVVLEGGDLARAVRASMAVPLVFDPERIEGRDLIDGGLAANVPINAARDAGAVQVIVSDVSWRPPDSVRADDPLAVADLMVAYLFTQPLDSLGPGDWVVRPAVDSFATLDFAPEKIPEIIRRGHEAAALAFAGHPVCGASAEAARATRAVYRVAGIRVAEGPADRLGLLRRQLGIAEGDWVDVPGLRERLQAISEADDYLEVWTQPSGPPDSLTFSLAVRPAAARMVVLGLSYDNDIGGEMWTGASDRGTLVRGLESSVMLVVGELRQELAVGLRPAAVGRHPHRPVLLGQADRQVVRQFTRSGAAAPEIRTEQAFGILGFEHRFGREWLATIGGLAHTWDAPGSAHSSGLGGTLMLASGPRYRTSGFWAEGAVTSGYRRVGVETRYSVGVGKTLRVTPSLRFGWGKDLPIQLTFPLGGTEGFPGLNIGEKRGDRELVAGMLLSRRLFGPVEFRLSGFTGKTAVGGPTLPRGRWETGGRVGFGAETPIGPIRAEYGIVRGGRNGVFLRIGEWY